MDIKEQLRLLGQCVCDLHATGQLGSDVFFQVKDSIVNVEHQPRRIVVECIKQDMDCVVGERYVWIDRGHNWNACGLPAVHGAEFGDHHKYICEYHPNLNIQAVGRDNAQPVATPKANWPDFTIGRKYPARHDRNIDATVCVLCDTGKFRHINSDAFDLHPPCNTIEQFDECKPVTPCPTCGHSAGEDKQPTVANPATVQTVDEPNNEIVEACDCLFACKTMILQEQIDAPVTLDRLNDCIAAMEQKYNIPVHILSNFVPTELNPLPPIDAAHPLKAGEWVVGAGQMYAFVVGVDLSGNTVLLDKRGRQWNTSKAAIRISPAEGQRRWHEGG